MTQSTLLRAATAAMLVLGLSGLGTTAAFADDSPAPGDATAAAAAPATEEAPAAEPAAAPEPSPAADPAPAPAPAPAADEAPSADPAPETVTPPTAAPAAAQRLTARTTSTQKTTASADNFGAVYLCHATQGANPWISEHPNAQAAYNGHVDPPNDKNDHVTDIIPAFDYNDHGNTAHFPGKNLATDFGGGITGAQILANDCVMPTAVTPAATATAQTCPQGTALVGGHIQLTMIAGVTYTITSPTNTNVPFNGSGLTGALAPGVYSVAFTHGTSVVTSVTSPFTVTITANDGPCGTAPTAVTPAATATQQTCDVDYQLVGGSIQLTVITGVTYTITAPDLSTVSYNGSGLATGLAPGAYKVSYSLAPGLTSSVTTPFTVTVPAFTGTCDATPYVLLAWHLPCGVASPWCPPGQNLVHTLDLTVPTLDALDNLLLGTCGDWQVDLEWDSPTTQALIAAGILTAPNSPQEDHAYGAVPGNPWKYIDNPDCPVTPAATAFDQSCSRAGTLVAGFIQVTVTPGVTYKITGPSGDVPFDGSGTTGDLPAGAYSVTYTLDTGYGSAVPNPIPLTIAPFGGACAPPVTVEPAATPAGQTCTADKVLQGGSIQLTLQAGVAYTITAPDGVTDVPFDALGKTGAIDPGTYSVTYTLDPGYSSAVVNPILVTVTAYDGDCTPPVAVTPAATPTAETCSLDNFLQQGSIQLTVLPGVTYTVTAPDGVTDVPYDVLGNTGPIAAGTYSVSFVVVPGYTTAVVSPFSVVVSPFDGVGCDLQTDPLVIPTATQAVGNCVQDGSYTLSNDQSDPAAIEWTVTDAGGTHTGVTSGTYSASKGQTVTLDAAPGPGFGFQAGTKTHWEFIFAATVGCLDSLAFTSGGAPGGLMSISAILLLVGVAALAVARRRRRVLS